MAHLDPAFLVGISVATLTTALVFWLSWRIAVRERAHILASSKPAAPKLTPRLESLKGWQTASAAC